MKNYKEIGIYDFSDYAEEITGDALFKINGGAEVENSDKGVAGAKPGDTIKRKNGDIIVLKQIDIDIANENLGNNGNDGTGNTNGNSGTGNNSNSNNTSNGYQNYSGGSNQTTATINTTKEEKQSLMYDPHDPSRVFVDLDDPKAMQQAADLLADPNLGLRITAYGSESGITKNFKNYKEINDYLNPVSEDEIVSVSLGGKVALIVGLGGEIGFIRASGNVYFYISGSIGCGIQTPSTIKTDLSIMQYLEKAVGYTASITSDSPQTGFSSSLTTDICLGVTGTYDLNNQKTSGLPNAWGFGSVGGGVWKTGTYVVPIHIKEETYD